MKIFVNLTEQPAGKWGKALFCCVLGAIILISYAAPVRAAYEQAPTLLAKNILKPELLRGKITRFKIM